MRALYGFIGAFVGAMTSLVINLLAAAIQQRSFGGQFQQGAIGWLIGLAVLGLLLGLWLGATLRLQPKQSPTGQTASARPVTMTRLWALLSYGKLRGQGIELNDIVMVGSVIKIDTRQ